MRQPDGEELERCVASGGLSPSRDRKGAEGSSNAAMRRLPCRNRTGKNSNAA